MVSDLALFKKNDIYKLAFILFLGISYGLITYITNMKLCGDTIQIFRFGKYLNYTILNFSESFYITLNILLNKIFLSNNLINHKTYFIYTSYYFYISNIIFYIFLRLQNFTRSVSLSLICWGGISFSVFIGTCQYTRQYICTLLSFLVIYSISKNRVKTKEILITLIIILIMVFTHAGFTFSLIFGYLAYLFIKKFINLLITYRLNLSKSIIYFLIVTVSLGLFYQLAARYLAPIFQYISYGYIDIGYQNTDMKVGSLSFLLYLITLFSIARWSLLLSKASQVYSEKNHNYKCIYNFIGISIIIFFTSQFIVPYIYRALVIKSIFAFLFLGLTFQYEKENLYLLNQKTRATLYQYKFLSLFLCIILFASEWTNIFEYF